MSRFTPKPAVRTGQKARLALSGPSGSGKTFAGLLIAEVLADGGPILVLDTERGSSALYSDRFTFEVIDWEPPYDPRELAAEIAERAGSFAVLMVDSGTHFWQGEGGTQSIVDRAAEKAKGNSYAGWAEGTPAQDAMVNALLSAPCHVIFTMRSKTEYVLQERNGKQVPVKLGMAPIQRPGIEFEFTVTCELDRDHNVSVDKSRCEAIADMTYGPEQVPDMAAALGAWLSSNEAAPTRPYVLLAERLAALPDEAQAKILGWFGVPVAEWSTLAENHVARLAEVITKAEATAEADAHALDNVADLNPDDPAPPDTLAHLTSRMRAITDDDQRAACHAAFEAAFGNPDQLMVLDLAEASALIAGYENARHAETAA